MISSSDILQAVTVVSQRNKSKFANSYACYYFDILYQRKGNPYQRKVIKGYHKL